MCLCRQRAHAVLDHQESDRSELVVIAVDADEDPVGPRPNLSSSDGASSRADSGGTRGEAETETREREMATRSREIGGLVIRMRRFLSGLVRDETEFQGFHFEGGRKRRMKIRETRRQHLRLVLDQTRRFLRTHGNDVPRLRRTILHQLLMDLPPKDENENDGRRRKELLHEKKTQKQQVLTYLEIHQVPSPIFDHFQLKNLLVYDGVNGCFFLENTEHLLACEGGHTCFCDTFIRIHRARWFLHDASVCMCVQMHVRMWSQQCGLLTHKMLGRARLWLSIMIFLRRGTPYHLASTISSCVYHIVLRLADRVVAGRSKH